MRWGQPGSPLLPEALRRALADEALPSWLLTDLHLPADATALALDQSPWLHIDELPGRVERYLITLLTYRLPQLGDLRISERPWPQGIRPKDVPWPTRVGNALRRSGYLRDPSGIESVTFGDLLAIPALGVKSVLEFAALVDAVTGTPAESLDEVARDDLMAAAEEGWVEWVESDDPRFRDVLPPFSGSVAELLEEAINNPEGVRATALAESLPRIRERASKIASEPLDTALIRLAEASGASERDVEMVCARLGWRGGDGQTLQEIADRFSVTRERVRQVIGRIVDQIHVAYVPQVERAVQIVTDSAPLRALDVGPLLVAAGHSSIPVAVSSLQATAEVFGYEVTFEIDPGDGVPYVLARGSVTSGPILSVSRRQSGRTGATNLEEVCAELINGDEGPAVEDVSRILRASPKVEFLVDDWFWMPGIPLDRNRLRNVARRMLSVTPALDLSTMRQGVRRRYRFMHIDLVPPTPVLEAFFRTHPEFRMDEHGSVESVSPLDYRDELGEVERTFVDVLRSVPAGLMDRTELEEAVTGRGVNPSTFSVFTTYSPILDHPAKNVWCLRGHAADPAKLEALLAAVATRPRRRRTLAYGWDDDGKLRLTVEIPSVTGPVIGIPSAIARYVAGRQFDASTLEGMPTGTVVINEEGASWGYGPFLRRRGAEVGDVMTLKFDLVTPSVTLSLGDDTALDEPEG